MNSLHTSGLHGAEGHQHKPQKLVCSQLQMLEKGCKVQMLLANFLDKPPLADDITHATECIECLPQVADCIFSQMLCQLHFDSCTPQHRVCWALHPFAHHLGQDACRMI